MSTRSKYEYVKCLESDKGLLLGTWIIVRVDGEKFKDFTLEHDFMKPGDTEAQCLMDAAARCVLEKIGDVVIAYGYSDEYSFVFHRDTGFMKRRMFKILTTLVSIFTASYQYLWGKYMKGRALKYPPTFDGRILLCSTPEILEDYLCWRQTECHTNNLYNTCFWALVKSGVSEREAESQLANTKSKDKHELLFSRFGINYNNIDEVFKKGTLLIRSGEIMSMNVNMAGSKQWRVMAGLGMPKESR